MAKKAKAAKVEKKRVIIAPRIDAANPAPTKPTSANPYKAGSRKAEIYDVFMETGGGEDGLKAAMKRADKLGIKPGTVKSWSGAWLKGVTKAPKVDKADRPTDGTPRADYYPWFKYTSRERADKGHEELCTRSGLRSHCYHVIEQDGRFAVVPSTYHPTTPVPAFQKGDIVYDAFIANTEAKVIGAGPEQSVIRYIKPRPTGPREHCVINRFLVKVPETEKKGKVQREKL